jgi:hypothetical protein
MRAYMEIYYFVSSCCESQVSITGPIVKVKCLLPVLFGKSNVYYLSCCESQVYITCPDVKVKCLLPVLL